ncbi:hypothetical protein OROMI_017009 [Orobanche minor]
MEPKIFPLGAITPETKNWTVKVSILNKTEPRTSSQPASIRFQKLLLVDNMENRVEAMLYRGDIELLKNSLRIDQTYLISNAAVRPVKPGFENPLTNNKYQWILGARTAILATDEDTLIISKLAPTFTHSDHFRDFLGKRTLISTAAVIIDSHPPRTVMVKGKENTLHEYSAVDELDISLSSTSASVVLIKSNIERVQDLQKWGLCIQKERIDVLQQQGDVFRNAQTNFSHDPESFTLIETLLTTEQEKFRFSLLVYDDSVEIEVTVFGDEGEKLMQMSANDFLIQYCNMVQQQCFANVLELSAPQKNETTSLPSTTKEHPSPDIHPNTSSRGRASKAKKTE